MKTLLRLHHFNGVMWACLLALAVNHAATGEYLWAVSTFALSCLNLRAVFRVGRAMHDIYVAHQMAAFADGLRNLLGGKK